MIDYQRDNMGQVIVDEKFGNPQGYDYGNLAMRIPTTQEAIPMRTGAGENNSEIIQLKPEEIIHIKIINMEDPGRGIGLFNSLEKLNLIRLNIEDSVGEAAHQNAFPFTLLKIGDERHEPSTEHYNFAAQQMSKMDAKSAVAVPYYVSAERMPAADLSKMNANLAYFLQLSAWGVGVPPYMVPGMKMSGSASENIMMMIEQMVSEYQKQFAYQIEKELFVKYAKIRKELTIPSIVLHQNSESAMLRRARRLALYKRADLIRYTPETEQFIRVAEKLPPIDLKNPPLPTQAASTNMPKQKEKEPEKSGKTKEIKGSGGNTKDKKDRDDDD